MSGGAVVLLSGGVDSTVLLHDIVRERGASAVRALSFDYGQKHRRELEMADWQAARAGVCEHGRLDLRGFGALAASHSALTDPAVAVPDLADIPDECRSQPPTYVPNRNLTLLALAAAFAESRGVVDVCYGAQRQDAYGYWDCTAEFLARVNAVLALNRVAPVRVLAPFVDWRKAAIVARGHALGVDFSHTWTCYRGARRPCGTCPSCVERAAAFAEAGVVDALSATGGGEKEQES